MKQTPWAFAPLLLCLAPLVSGQYTYYHSENLYPSPSSYWATGGATLSPYYYSPGSYGGVGSNLAGSLIGPGYQSSPNCNGNEVMMIVRQDPTNPGGTFSAYLAATDQSGNVPLGSRFYGSPHGNYFRVAAVSEGQYASNLQVIVGQADQYDNTTETILNSVNTTIPDGSVIRAIFKPIFSTTVGTPYAQIIVYLNNVLMINYPLIVSGSQADYGTCGAFGVGVENTEPTGLQGGNLLTQVNLGNLDTTPPNAISASSIGINATTNSISLQWPAATDNSGGVGIYGYQIFRNGGLLQTTTALSYVDTGGIVPSTSYTYTLTVLDYDMNATSTTFTVETLAVLTTCSIGQTGTAGPCPSASQDGRRVGVRPTGAYWGGTNENIDVLSGNLNYSYPLLKAQARGGVSVPFNLVYNVQNWRQDSGGQWVYDGDVGYGFGWQLLAASIMPVWNPNGFTANYYLFSDSTGAQYHLNQNSGSIWSSQESVYVYFDASVNVLHLKDGTSWTFGCISASTEADAGVMHPTLIEDTNGNQITISYLTAPGANWANSSARIATISDVRATSAYTFTYNSDSPPHLTAIRNNVQTGEAYNFTYSSEAIQSPFTHPESFGTSAVLSTAVVNTLNMTTSFTYDSSAELTQVVLPYGGYLAYNYTTTTYSTGVSYREVLQRHLSSSGTSATDIVYPLAHESSPGATVHQYTTIADPSGTGEKYWTFTTSGLAQGLVTQYQGIQMPSAVAKTQNNFTWAQDGVGNSYIATSQTTLDPGQSYQAVKQTTQTVDNYGNVLQVQNYDYNNLSTPLRTYTYTWLHTNSNTYTSLYILNRMTGASVTDGTTNVSLGSIAYDEYNYDAPNSCNVLPQLASASPGWAWDSSFANTSITARGNPVVTITPSGITCTAYDVTGNPVSLTVNGVQTQVTASTSNNLAVPSELTVGSLTTDLNWSTFLGLTQATGPNGDSASTNYDQYGRPDGGVSPFGAQTQIVYSNPPYNSTTPPTITTKITNSSSGPRWTMKTLDGLGRTILTSTGDSTSTNSQAESVYGPCACSPMGKLMQ
jgi:hypothetical protein